MKTFFPTCIKSGFGAALALALFMCSASLLLYGQLPPFHVTCHNMALAWLCAGMVMATIHIDRAITLNSSLISIVFVSATMVAIVVAIVHLQAAQLLVPLLAALPWLALLSVLLGLGAYLGTRLATSLVPCLAAALLLLALSL